MVTHNSDSQDILMLDQPSEVFHDAQESLCLESTVSVEILVSGKVSHAWILDSGASLHVTLHREWSSRYEETVGIRVARIHRKLEGEEALEHTTQ